MVSVHEKRGKTGNRHRTHGDGGERHGGGYFRERRATVKSGQYLYGPTENKNKSMNTSVISCKQRKMACSWMRLLKRWRNEEQQLPFRVTDSSRWASKKNKLRQNRSPHFTPFCTNSFNQCMLFTPLLSVLFVLLVPNPDHGLPLRFL